MQLNMDVQVPLKIHRMGQMLSMHKELCWLIRHLGG